MTDKEFLDQLEQEQREDVDNIINELTRGITETKEYLKNNNISNEEKQTVKNFCLRTIEYYISWMKNEELSEDEQRLYNFMIGAKGEIEELFR